MAVLVDTRTQQSYLMEAETVVGRSLGCSLRIAQPYVSGRHAALRWDGQHWEIKDLGSRNGTFVDGARLPVGQSHRLAQGARIAFGNELEVWALQDDSAPVVMAVPLDGGPPVLSEHEVLGLPSAEDPQATIFRDVDGTWKLEAAEGDVIALEPQATFHAVGRVWRFSCPDSTGATVTIAEGTTTGALRLRFIVSRDEEHVEVGVVQGARLLSLGTRNHNYLLLTLARARRDDAANGVPDSACGWVYQDDLLQALRTTSAQLNIDVFRIRQHFSKSGFQDLVNVIERRPSSKQLRIGIPTFEIETL